MKKRQRPKPGKVTIRHVGGTGPVEVVAPDELEARKLQAEWEQYASSRGLDDYDEHARLALRLGDPVAAPFLTGEMWWFVCDVNGPARTITVRTFIFDMPTERTFALEMVEPLRLRHIAEKNEAARVWVRLNASLGTPAYRRQRRHGKAA